MITIDPVVLVLGQRRKLPALHQATAYHCRLVDIGRRSTFS